MKKNSLLPGILTIIGLLAIVGALLFPLGDGLIANFAGYPEAAQGYDFVFGNSALLINDPYGGMIAWFVLLLIAAFFGIIGCVLSFFGGKLGAFCDFLTGLICFVCALLFFLAPVTVGSTWTSADVSLGWGYIAAGACAAVAALLNLFIGGKGLFSKKA